MTQTIEKPAAFSTVLDKRVPVGPRWFEDLRTRAAGKFAQLGIPTVRDEEWRFTNVTPIASSDFTVAGPISGAADRLSGIAYADAHVRLVVVNGRFDATLSKTKAPHAGVKMGSLATALTDHADVVQRYFGQVADFSTRPFTALNTALVQDGVFVHVLDGAVLEHPIHIVYVTGADASRVMAQPRTLIVAGANSQLRVVESFVGANSETYFTNAVSEIFVGENASVDHYKVQQESFHAFHIGSVHVHMARSATFSSHSFALGGKLVRNDAFAILDGEGGDCTLNGLYLADRDRLVDNHTTIDHAKAHCGSHEVYKGILGGTSRAVFNGKIIVRQDAQKTDAKQTNRALLLTDGATINTKPQLEIFADDVKCTHGATVGQLDGEEVFYLQSRGLSHDVARNLLTYAFGAEVIDRIPVASLRRRLEQAVLERTARQP